MEFSYHSPLRNNENRTTLNTYSTLLILNEFMSNIIQLSPEGEVNSGGNIRRREESRYISSACRIRLLLLDSLEQLQQKKRKYRINKRGPKTSQKR